VTSPVITPNKIARLIACIEKAPELMVVVDNETNIIDLNHAGESIKKPIHVLVDLDPGIGRTGVKFEDALLFGKKINQLKWLTLVGIQCYAGNLQHIAAYDARKHQSLAIMEKASNMVKKFRTNGLPCSILTGTGTGTYDIDIETTEVTEIQPGSYTLMDVEYAAIASKENSEAFSTFKPAMTLLTTVISSNRREHVTVDAGTKSIYVDSINKPKIISHEGLEYAWGGFGDEHGKITASKHTPLPSNGEVLELIVPHCDPTINLFDKFYITEHDRVVDIWDIDLRGKSQ
jgi:D-serine deaminase-like pyridoxal phosphate-dependent protein